jgi:hypothetical protein
MMFILNAIILTSGMLFGVAIIFAIMVVAMHAFLIDDE